MSTRVEPILKAIEKEMVELSFEERQEQRDQLLHVYSNYPERYPQYAQALGRHVGEFPTMDNKADLIRILFFGFEYYYTDSALMQVDLSEGSDTKTCFVALALNKNSIREAVNYFEAACRYGMPCHIEFCRPRPQEYCLGYCRAWHFFTSAVEVSKVRQLIRFMLEAANLSAWTPIFLCESHPAVPELVAGDFLSAPLEKEGAEFVDPRTFKPYDTWNYLLKVVSEELLAKKEGMILPGWVDELLENRKVLEAGNMHRERLHEEEQEAKEKLAETDRSIEKLFEDFERELDEELEAETAIADGIEGFDNGDKFNEQDVRTFFRRLNHSGHGLTELAVCCPNGGRIQATGFFSDEDAFVRACREWNGRANIYTGRNPRPFVILARNGLEANGMYTDKLVRATDRDIEWVTAVSLDIDPIRMRGTSSTSAQHKTALEFATMIAHDVGGSVDDSGNGAYVWIPINPIKVTDEDRDMVKAQCRKWQDEFRDKYQPEKYGMKIDSVHDLSRIKKVIGTLSVKGEIHRRSRFYTGPVMEPHSSLDQVILNIEVETTSSEPIEIEVGDQLPKRFQELLQTDERLKEHWQTQDKNDDSSVHDWRLGLMCYERGITDPNELATILSLNPNGKVQAGRAPEPYLRITLSRLIERAEREQATRKVSERIIEIRKDPEIKGKKVRIAELVHRDLQRRGKFIRSRNRLYYFPRDEKKLMKIDNAGMDFIALLCDLYGLVETEPDCRYFLAYTKATCYRHGEQIEVYRYVHYDKANFKLYIDRFDTKMYVLDSSSITLEDNGFDGVLFENDDLAQAYEVSSDPGECNLFDSYIIGRANFESDVNTDLSIKEQQLLFRVWLWSTYFGMPTRPLLLFYGPKGSGKTAISKMVLKLLFGDRSDVSSVTDDERDFDALIANRHLIVLDNADAFKPWLNDRLAKLATGQAIEKRELYTTMELTVCFPECHAIITARTPKFRQDDIADRTIVLNVKRFEQFMREDGLMSQVLANRNQILSELFWQLNRCIQKLKQNQGMEYMGSFRMADFADFGYKLFDGSQVFLNTLDKINKAQDEFLLETDPIIEFLDEWIDRGNHAREVTAKELFVELKDIARADEIEFWYKTPRALSMKIHHQVKNLEQFFDIQIKKQRRGGNSYKLEKK